MRILFKTILAGIICVALSSCHDAVKISESDVDTIDLFSSTTETNDLEDYVDEVKILSFNKDSLLFVNPKKMLIGSDKLIVLSGGQVYAFSLEGYFIGPVGRIGRGPGEYVSISDICLNVKGDEIYCLDNVNHVLRFSSASLDYISTVNAQLSGLSANAVVPLTSNTFGLLVNNPEDPSDFQNEFRCLKCFNMEGTPTDEFLPREDFSMPINFFPSSIQNPDNNYILSYIPTSGIFYQIGQGKISPFADLSLGKKGMPSRFTVENGADPWSKVNEVMEASFFKCISTVCHTSRAMYCCALGDHSARYNFVIDTKSGKGIRWQSSRFIMPMAPIVSDQDYFYFVLVDSGLPMEMNTSMAPDPLQSVIKGKAGIVSEVNDPVVAKVKFRL